MPLTLSTSFVSFATRLTALSTQKSTAPACARSSIGAALSTADAARGRPNILLRLKTVVGPVATRTPERYRVKVGVRTGVAKTGPSPPALDLIRPQVPWQPRWLRQEGELRLQPQDLVPPNCLPVGYVISGHSLPHLDLAGPRQPAVRWHQMASPR
jgi:hypothetical protein